MIYEYMKNRFNTCRNEQEFKMKFIKNASNKDNFHAFCIETEETVKGFPDVMCIRKDNNEVSFEEFKFTKTGKIKFQPTQPSFYKKYVSLFILIVAYNAKTDTVHTFSPALLFDKESPYCMNEKAEVDLCKAESNLISMK